MINITHRHTQAVILSLDIPSLQYANLEGANLRGADLRGANLRNANLQYANLRNANLEGADLRNANLRSADLRNADLQYANLRSANLRSANLRNADLRNAYLQYANLEGADLRGADLRGADLQNCAAAQLQCPEPGLFTAYKKGANSCIITLQIPASAKRSSATSRKCRASKAKCAKIETPTGEAITSCASNYDEAFIYEVGKTVIVPDFCEDRWAECAAGIHFFITRQEAVDY